MALNENHVKIQIMLDNGNFNEGIQAMIDETDHMNNRFDQTNESLQNIPLDKISSDLNDVASKVYNAASNTTLLSQSSDELKGMFDGVLGSLFNLTDTLQDYKESLNNVTESNILLALVNFANTLSNAASEAVEVGQESDEAGAGLKHFAQSVVEGIPIIGTWISKLIEGRDITAQLEQQMEDFIAEVNNLASIEATNRDFYEAQIKLTDNLEEQAMWQQSIIKSYETEIIIKENLLKTDLTSLEYAETKADLAQLEVEKMEYIASLSEDQLTSEELRIQRLERELDIAEANHELEEIRATEYTGYIQEQIELLLELQSLEDDYLEKLKMQSEIERLQNSLLREKSEIIDNKIIPALKDQIALGLLDPENFQDVASIQSVLQASGMSGIDQLTSLQDLGVTGATYDQSSQVTRTINQTNNITMISPDENVVAATLYGQLLDTIGG